MRVLLPRVIEALIKSYLPPPSAWVPPYLRQLDTMRVSDWELMVPNLTVLGVIF